MKSVTREKWEKEDGVRFLKKAGVRPGQTVLDFGARVGYYTIPLARLVGKNGKVVALDKDREALAETGRKADHCGLTNVELGPTDGSHKLESADAAFDAVLVYDVLHLIEDRKKLYQEVRRVLKPKGLLSVYPKHNKEDSPGWGLEHMTPDDIREEIEGSGFTFKHKQCGTISHDEGFNPGCVLNFIKKNKC